MANWEEKSQYLLREIVKYELYIDSLQAAMTLRLKKRGEKGKHHPRMVVMISLIPLTSLGTRSKSLNPS
jgi:hypothetical protein